MSIQENRERLLRALRNEEFPEDFHWDFSATYNRELGCGCAMGLAYRLGIVGLNEWWPPVVADRLGIPVADAEAVFYPLDYYKRDGQYARGYRVLFKRYPVEDGGGK